MRTRDALSLAALLASGCDDAARSSGPGDAARPATLALDSAPVDPPIPGADALPILTGDTGGVSEDVGVPSDARPVAPDAPGAAGSDAGGPVCDPAAPVFCRNGERFRCAPDGAAAAPEPCATGEVCTGGQCVDAQGNVLLLVDTSTSMNAVVGRDVYARDCLGAGCPTWDWPRCDDPAAPATRIARVKVALQRLFASEGARDLRLALQRFPQRGDDSPDCDDGYNWGLRAMEDHDGQTETSLDTWFGAHLGQVVAVPFADAAAPPLAELNRWVDFTEGTRPTAQACVNNWDCASNICDADRCLEVADPELRGVGFTPIGKSLFYAGEYFRHRVLVEGKACGADADCASPHHTCVEGQCHDPLNACRPNVVVLLTDGGETEDRDTGGFFHPRIQAKRLHTGLGCMADADCAGEATCADGSCQPLLEPYPAGERMCSVFGTPCAGDADCIEPCTGGQCPVTCGDARIEGMTQGPAGRITDHAGRPVSMTLHVVDASGVAGGNADLAAYGGGLAVGVDLVDVDALVDRLTPLLDTKTLLARCPELASEGR